MCTRVWEDINHSFVSSAPRKPSRTRVSLRALCGMVRPGVLIFDDQLNIKSTRYPFSTGKQSWNLSSESIATVLKQLKDLQVVPAEGINVSLALFWYVSRLTCQPYRRSTSVRTILRKFSLIYKARVRLNCVLPLCFQLSSPADGTPFHNGTFKMKLILPTDYPRCPPRGENVKSVCHGCCLHC